MTTSDGGLSWTVVPTGLQQSLVFAHASSASELYVAREGLYRSTNGGSTWSQIPTPAGTGVSEVHFDGARRVAIQGGSLTYSTNSGTSWQVGFAGQSGVFFDELHFPSATVGYASGGITTELGSIGSVLRTQDGGASWSVLSFPHGQITAADFRTTENGVVSTISSNLYTTSDGGASWQLLAGLPDAAVLLDLVQRNAAHWYGASLSGCVYETFNAGVAWTSTYCSPTSHALSAISLDSGAAIVVGNNGQVLYENRIFGDGFN
ncbi:MAG: hypothetical protein ABI650_06005 [Dokdonella sp.]